MTVRERGAVERREKGRDQKEKGSSAHFLDLGLLDLVVERLLRLELVPVREPVQARRGRVGASWALAMSGNTVCVLFVVGTGTFGAGRRDEYGR